MATDPTPTPNPADKSSDHADSATFCSRCCDDKRHKRDGSCPNCAAGASILCPRHAKIAADLESQREQFADRGTPRQKLFRYAGKLRRSGLDDTAIFQACLAWTKATFDDSPSEESIKRIILRTAKHVGEEVVALEDFYAFMPMHTYLHIPNRGEPWPAASVNARIAPIETGEKDDKGKEKTIKAATWLDQNRPVEQMTWWPGKPELIVGAMYHSGALIEQDRALKIYNTYRPPTIKPGDPNAATRWVDLIHTLYPDEAEHLISWFAHRVQRPFEKINHAIVLGGAPGIGKDTIMVPVGAAIGDWNMTEVGPVAVMGTFTGFLRSVILRISEARDLGDVDKFKFYEHTKTYIAAPPDILRINEKHLREYEIPNLLSVVITSNHRTNGIYLPPDDRRHFVMWSEKTIHDFTEGFWTSFYEWLEKEGKRNVAAYLMQYDLSDFNPKAPPRKTPAFFAITDSNSSPEDDELSSVLEAIDRPAALILEDITCSKHVKTEFALWFADRKNAKSVPYRLEEAGYVSVRNDRNARGKWSIEGVNRMIYGRSDLSVRDRVSAARDRAAKQLQLFRPGFVKENDVC
jgi:hypothetical protein